MTGLPDPPAARTEPSPPAAVGRAPGRTHLERAAYVVAIVGPLTTCPQIVQTYGSRSAEDVSTSAWIGFTLYSAFRVFYGASRKDWPLTLANALWSVLQMVVVVGAVIYS